MNTIRTMVAVILAAGALSLPTMARAQAEFLSKLAPGGGKVIFRTGKFENGDPGWFQFGRHPESDQLIFRAEGALYLKTPELELRCGELRYDAESSQLIAETDVDFRTRGVVALCQRLEYNQDSGQARLTGEPDVTQVSEEYRSSFIGMEVFSIREEKSGEQLVELTGEKPIVITIEERAQPNGDTDGSTPSPAGGLSELGKTLKITVSPLPPEQPRVRSVLTKAGELSVFQATGSVLLESDRFDLRANSMIYNRDDQRFEAVGSVYFSQKGVEADAGRMLYDLASETITLSVSPDIRLTEARGLTHIYDYDVVILEPREGSVPDIKVIGDQGTTEFTPIEGAVDAATN